MDYILNPKKGAHVVIARGVSGCTDIGMLTEDFNRQCELRPSLKVKAVHIPISFHVNDTAMLEVHTEEIIGDWIRHMEWHGYRFDQFIVGRHHDKDDKNPHFHFLANVVLDDGTRANLANIGKAAKEASISADELDKVPGTGYLGRLSKKDIMNYIETRGSQQTQAGRDIQSSQPIPEKRLRPVEKPVEDILKTSASLAASYEGKNVEVKDMDAVGKIIADRMILSKQTSAHVTTVIEVDVTKLVNWRKKNKDNFQLLQQASLY